MTRRLRKRLLTGWARRLIGWWCAQRRRIDAFLAEVNADLARSDRALDEVHAAQRAAAVQMELLDQRLSQLEGKVDSAILLLMRRLE